MQLMGCSCHTPDVFWHFISSVAFALERSWQGQIACYGTMDNSLQAFVDVGNF